MATKHWKWTSTHSFLEMLEKFGLWNGYRNEKTTILMRLKMILNKHLVFRCNLDQFNFNIRRISCVNVGENQKNEKNWKTIREIMKKKLKKKSISSTFRSYFRYFRTRNQFVLSACDSIEKWCKDEMLTRSSTPISTLFGVLFRFLSCFRFINQKGSIKKVHWRVWRLLPFTLSLYLFSVYISRLNL